MQWAEADGGDELGLNARGAVRIEEVRIGQLLEPRKAERDAEKRSEREQRPTGQGQRPRRRSVKTDSLAASSRPLSTRSSLAIIVGHGSLWHLDSPCRRTLPRDADTLGPRTAGLSARPVPPGLETRSAYVSPPCHSGIWYGWVDPWPCEFEEALVLRKHLNGIPQLQGG